MQGVNIEMFITYIEGARSLFPRNTKGSPWQEVATVAKAAQTL